MKQLKNALKTLRISQWLLLAAAICILAIIGMGNTENRASLSTEEEKRMERILSEIEGAGKTTVMISCGEGNEKHGVVVAASGIKNIQTMLEMQRAVQTLTGLDLNQIEIVISER